MPCLYCHRSNKDLFYKDLTDGASTIVVGGFGYNDKPMAFVGGNCSLQVCAELAVFQPLVGIAAQWWHFCCQSKGEAGSLRASLLIFACPSLAQTGQGLGNIGCAI